MTPGIQPSNVKIRLRKKLAMRPVKSTANGGKTTQKKYRSAFIANSSPSALSLSSSALAFPVQSSVIRHLRLPDSTANHDKAGAAAIQALRFALRSRSPCISQFAHSEPPAFPSGALRHGPRCPADPAPRLLASRSPWRSSRHNIAAICSDKRNRHLLQNDDVEIAIPSENIHSYISFVVSREQKINACISHFQITNADLWKKLWQEWLRKHQPSFLSKNIEPETRLEQKKYSARGPRLRSAGYWIQCRRFTGPPRKAAK